MGDKSHIVGDGRTGQCVDGRERVSVYHGVCWGLERVYRAPRMATNSVCNTEEPEGRRHISVAPPVTAAAPALPSGETEPSVK